MLRRLMRRGIARDRRGTALVEFAAVLPVVIVLWLGSLQLEDGIACNRKVTIATRAIADLVAQNVSGTMTRSDIDSNLSAVTMVLAPYDASRATVRITQVYTDSALRTTVVWSRGYNVAGYAPATVVNMPVGLKVPGTYMLYAEVGYAYRPPMNFGYIGALQLGDTLFMLPRNSNRIDCTDC